MEIQNSSKIKQVPIVLKEWMTILNNKPKNKLLLANLPTPIEKFTCLTSIPTKFSIYIKRDDLTGCNLSGNKIRKLEFFMSDILENKCTHVITAGAHQSNHVRATALVCAQLGIKCHAVVFGPKNCETNNIKLTGNYLMSHLCGTKFHFFTPSSSLLMEMCENKMDEVYKELMAKEENCKPYIIPTGGANSLGIYGYIFAFQEMLDQGIEEFCDDIVVSCGTGGTVEGLAIANYLYGSKFKIHGVTIAVHSTHKYDFIDKTLKELNLINVKSRDIVDIIDGYIGDGYGIASKADYKQIRDICESSGILFDTTFTNKGINGLIGEINKCPERFKGRRVLFIHTGGIFGLFDEKHEAHF